MLDGQLSLAIDAPASSSPPRRRSIEDRFASFHAANPHVLELLRDLARERLGAGATWIGVKELWEHARAHAANNEPRGTYKFDNSFTALYARRLIELEPRLADVMRVRARKGER